VSLVGKGDPKGVTKTAKIPDVALVPHQRLGCPGVGAVDHAHPLEHHEGMKSAAGGQDGPHIGSDCAELTDKGVAH
jgi:hypothetical protein